MQKRKTGEQEAITILENLGIEIDKDYYDDNSQKNMPDIKYKDDDRYIEITHTLHNNAIPEHIRKFDQPQRGETWNDYTQRHLDMGIKCNLAYNRIRKRDYEKDDKGNFTPKGQSLFKKDAKLLKNHMGYDVTQMDIAKQFSEFNCDRPIMRFSTDNILREITKDKGKKYPNGNVDLFIFATDGEFRLIKELVRQKKWNGAAKQFLNQILLSPFPTIYVCEWCFEAQSYNINNPQLMIFRKQGEGLKIELKNGG